MNYAWIIVISVCITIALILAIDVKDTSSKTNKTISKDTKCPDKKIMYSSIKQIGRQENNKDHTKVRLYIHLACVGRWKPVFRRLVKYVKYSNFHGVITLSWVGDYELNKSDVYYMTPSHWRKEYTGDERQYERATLLYMQREAFEDNFYALYIHSKGVTKTVSEKSRNVEAWVHFMIYFLLQVSLCSEYLDRGYDTVGVNWQTQYPHYSGNMWWASSNYLRSLPTSIAPHYSAPEEWIGNNTPKAVCLFKPEKNDLYEVCIPCQLYMNRSSVTIYND